MKISGTDSGGTYTNEVVAIPLSVIVDVSPSPPGNLDLISSANPIASFNTQALNSTTTVTMTLQNFGDWNVTLSASDALVIGGTDAGQFGFAAGGTCTNSFTILGGGSFSCTKDITFTPTSSGKKSAFVRVTHSASGSPRVYKLSGVGAGGTPSMLVSRSKLFFGSQTAGSNSPPQAVSVRSVGTAEIQGNPNAVSAVLSGTHAAQFSVINNCPANLLENGPACTIDVRFNPVAPSGTKTAVLTISGTGLSPVTIDLGGLSPGDVPPISFGDFDGTIVSEPPAPPPDVTMPTNSRLLSTPSDRSTTMAVPAGSLNIQPVQSLVTSDCVGECGGATRSIESLASDLLSGSIYRVTRLPASSLLNQRWALEYRGNTGVLFARSELPATAEVTWRRRDLTDLRLPTTGWARVCADRVWAAQDGYAFIAHVGDRGLADLRRIEAPTNEVSVISDLSCASGGGLHVAAFLFDVSDNEPPLRADSVVASRVELTFDRTGRITNRVTLPIQFNFKEFCATAANEQYAICETARQAVGW
ncbi:MAG: choice-of-anchor D domain-containing protein [Gammaproteobacteria bacterium]